MTNRIPIVNLEASRDDKPPVYAQGGATTMITDKAIMEGTADPSGQLQPPVDAQAKGRTVITDKAIPGTPATDHFSHTQNPFEGAFGGFLTHQV